MSDLRQYEVWAQTKAFQRKVESSVDTLLAAAALGPIAVLTSWGKDSTALCGLAVEALGRPTLVHLSSPYELPGAEPVADHFSSLADVVSVPSDRTIAQVVAWLRDLGGLHHEREGSRDGGIKRKASRGVNWSKANGYAVEALGMRAEESKKRERCFRILGTTYSSHGLVCTCPLAWWSSKDVWAFIASRGLPYNRRVYDAETHGKTRETIRNTGWLSTVGAGEGWCAWLRQHFPEQWEMLADEFPTVRLVS